MEEDPEIAAALLREAYKNDNKWQLTQAMRLSIITGSNGLAEHYYARWAEKMKPEELENWFGLSSPWPAVNTFRKQKRRGESD